MSFHLHVTRPGTFTCDLDFDTYDELAEVIVMWVEMTLQRGWEFWWWERE